MRFFLLKSPVTCLIIVGIFFVSTTPTRGHQGHDHGDDHSMGEDTIPETDKEWSDPAVHRLSFNGVTLKWKDDPRDSRSVIMKMSGRTLGYVSVGFCVVWTGGMEKCDIVLGWVDSSGIASVHDYWGIGNTTPELDKKQNIELMSGKEANGITSIVFKRQWDSGDDEQDANLQHNQNVHVIYAWHEQDPVSSTNFQKHGSGTRGHTLKSVAIKGHQHGNSNRLVGGSFSALSITMCAIAWYFLKI